jgi:DNA-binding Lrp family transcriptional regulator
MTHLKKNIYFSRQDFTKHICTITLGRYLYDGSTSVSFLEVAEYLSVSPDSLRMRKKDLKTMGMLEAEGITVTKIKGINHFHLSNIKLYITTEEVEDEDETEAPGDNTMII